MLAPYGDAGPEPAYRGPLYRYGASKLQDVQPRLKLPIGSVCCLVAAATTILCVGLYVRIASLPPLTLPPPPPPPPFALSSAWASPPPPGPPTGLDAIVGLAHLYPHLLLLLLLLPYAFRLVWDGMTQWCCCCFPPGLDGPLTLVGRPLKIGDVAGTPTPPTWHDALATREDLGFSEPYCQLMLATWSRLLLCHVLQPLVCLLALRTFWGELGVVSQWLGVFLGARELLYAVGVLVVARANPCFLLVDAGASW